MSKRFRVSSLLRQKLVELSVPPDAVLRHAGLPPTLFDEDKIYVSTEAFFALYRAIGDVSGDPFIGLKLGSEDRVERYDPIAIAALYSRTFRDALERSARFKQLTCPEKILVTDRGSECWVRFVWTLAKGTEPDIVTDLCFAWIMSIAKRGMGRRITPVRIDLERASTQRQLYEAHFGCKVRFNAPENAMVFARSDVEQPFLTQNADLLAMVAPRLEEELEAQLKSQPFEEQVKTVLKRLLAGGRPEMRDVARELGQSTRTLQRRLTEANVTFQGVLESARRELARHYLLQSRLELNETAYLLGFEDSNSFFRAFRRWEGAPPGEWRERRLGGSTHG
jgi:AraC-like DNA-binding protein